MKRIPILLALAFAAGPLQTPAAAAGVEIGDTLKLTIRGVPAADQPQINGDYHVGDSGSLRLPLLSTPLPVRGLTADQIAAAAEGAYRKAAIFPHPSIEVQVMTGANIQQGLPTVSVGGQVNRSGPIPFKKGLTVMEAIQGAGERTPFGGRNISVFRGKRVIQLDYRKPEAKNFELLPSDKIVVDRKRVNEFDIG